MLVLSAGTTIFLEELEEHVRAFNPYDLYSKTPVRPDIGQLKPFYEDLIAEYFPPTLRW